MTRNHLWRLSVTLPGGRKANYGFTACVSDVATKAAARIKAIASSKGLSTFGIDWDIIKLA